jgi:hypothetical protein
VTRNEPRRESVKVAMFYIFLQKASCFARPRDAGVPPNDPVWRRTSPRHQLSAPRCVCVCVCVPRRAARERAIGQTCWFPISLFFTVLQLRSLWGVRLRESACTHYLCPHIYMNEGQHEIVPPRGEREHSAAPIEEMVKPRLCSCTSGGHGPAHAG